MRSSFSNASCLQPLCAQIAAEDVSAAAQAACGRDMHETEYKTAEQRFAQHVIQVLGLMAS
jgi:hypothetical protein